MTPNHDISSSISVYFLNIIGGLRLPHSMMLDQKINVILYSLPDSKDMVKQKIFTPINIPQLNLLIVIIESLRLMNNLNIHFYT